MMAGRTRVSAMVALAAVAIVASAPIIAHAASNSLLSSCHFLKVSTQGDDTVLALTDDGHVVGWGRSDSTYRQLLRSATREGWTGSLFAIPNLDDVIDIDATSSMAMVLRSDRKLWSWGYNYGGQLGTGNMLDSEVPVPVVGLDNVVAFSVGGPSVALRSDGTVWAWGSNFYNEIGIPAPPYSVSVPTLVSALSGVTAVAAGNGFTLALLGDGTLRAWGSNSSGNLGIGTMTTSEMIPVQPVGLADVVAIAASGYSLALKSDGTVWWWGIATGSTVPVQVAGLPAIKSIAVARVRSLAAADDGSFWAWGGANRYGQQGDGTDVFRMTPPVRMINLSGNVVQLGGGYNSTIAVMADGTLRISGMAAAPQNDQYKPVPIPGLDNVVDISADTFVGFAVRSDGSLWSWGGNEYGELGNGSLDDSWSPQQILASGVADVEASTYYTLARLQNGTVAAWGLNRNGQLGDGSTIDRLSPVVNPFLAGVTAVAAGSSHALALLQDGTVQAWGENDYGELGTGDKVSSTTPLPVTGLSDVQAVAAGSQFSFALKTDGTLWAWGRNHPAAGSGVGIVPRQVMALASERVVAIRANYTWSLALTDTGAVYRGGEYYKDKWGDPFFYWCPLGSGFPNAVPAMQGAQSIHQADGQPYAVRIDGTVLTWGRNRFGSLGTQQPGPQCDPAPILDLANVAQIDSGYGQTVVLHRDGTLSSWGWNHQGALGIGTSSSSLVHVEPVFEWLPFPQGNIIRAVRSGSDVRFNFKDGTGPAWRIFRDGAKEVMATTAIVPDSVGLIYDDVGAVTASGPYFYQVRGVTVCGGLLGP